MTFLLSVWSCMLSLFLWVLQLVVLLIQIISEFKFSVHVSANDCERLPN